jgi:hypothetical protein
VIGKRVIKAVQGAHDIAAGGEGQAAAAGEDRERPGPVHLLRPGCHKSMMRSASLRQRGLAVTAVVVGLRASGRLARRPDADRRLRFGDRGVGHQVGSLPPC